MKKPQFLDNHVATLSTIGLCLTMAVAALVPSSGIPTSKPTKSAIINAPERVEMPESEGLDDTIPVIPFPIMDESHQKELSAKLMPKTKTHQKYASK